APDGGGPGALRRGAPQFAGAIPEGAAGRGHFAGSTPGGRVEPARARPAPDAREVAGLDAGVGGEAEADGVAGSVPAAGAGRGRGACGVGGSASVDEGSGADRGDGASRQWDAGARGCAGADADAL